jgi:hypothetical protein
MTRAQRWTFGAGWIVMAFGIWGLFNDSARTHPTEWARWFFGALVVHDFVVAPIVFLVAALLLARIPARWKAPLQCGLIASAIVAATAWPFLRGYGRRPDNSSVLPNNYSVGLLVVIGLIWIAVGAVTALLRAWASDSQ